MVGLIYMSFTLSERQMDPRNNQLAMGRVQYILYILEQQVLERL